MLGHRRRGFSATASPTTGALAISGRTGTVTDISESGNEDVVDAVYPLAIYWPREAGTTPESGATAFPSNHRIFWAHTSGYQIIARPRGGMRPYTHALTNAPAGMSIDADTGVITWPNPSGTVTPTYHLTDAHGDTLSEPWTITTDNSRFRFFSPSGNDTTGDGSEANPWRGFTRVNSSTNANLICVFRTGEYPLTGLYTNGVTTRTVTTANFTPTTTSFELEGTTAVSGLTCLFADGAAAGVGQLVTGGSVQGSNYRVTSLHAAFPTPPSNGSICGVGNTWQRKEWSASVHSMQWIAYYGERWSPNGSFASPQADWGAMNRVTGNSTTPVWVDHCDPVNFLDKCFQVAAGPYTCFWDMGMDEDTIRYTIDGSNSGMIMQLGVTGQYAFGGLYSDITVDGAEGGPLKCYFQVSPLYQRIIARNGVHSWDLKAAQDGYEVAECTYRLTHALQGGLFGNMSSDEATPHYTTGAIYFSLMDMRDAAVPAEAFAIDIGQDGEALGTYVIRCTAIGRVLARNLPVGPIRFDRCVILNDDTGFTDRVYASNLGVGVLTFGDNITGAIGDGIVDASGNLTGASAVYRGYYGWEYAA